jgi:hypothetical protein
LKTPGDLCQMSNHDRRTRLVDAVYLRFAGGFTR